MDEEQYNTNETDYMIFRGLNVTLHNSSECYDCDDNTAALINVFIMLLLIVVIIIGNMLVILAVITTKKLRTVTNYFVTSLSVADLLVGIFVMPPAIAVYLKGEWPLGAVLCVIWISLDILLCTASILSLCAISIDRYLAITRPLSYSRRRRSKKLALIMIIGVWLAAIAITCPPFFGWRESEHRSGVCRYNQNPTYLIFSAMGSFFIPMCVMVYVYLKISLVIAKRHQQLNENTSGKTKRQRRFDSEMIDQPLGHSDTSSFKDIKYSKCETTNLCSFRSRSTSQLRMTFRCNSGRSSENNRVYSLRRETKTAQTLSFVVGGFIVCWLPFFMYYILPAFVDLKINVEIMNLFTWLGWFNSAINPFIYAFYSKDFRSAFVKLTVHRCINSKNHRLV